MSLDRKDVRFKCDDDVHKGLALLADMEQQDIGGWCEEVITREVWRRIKAATVLAERAARAGISGKNREAAGDGQ